MAIVRPFKALRPIPEAAARVAAVPYDVIDSTEAQALAAGNPLSFLRVTRSEIDLPDEQDHYASAIYEKARDNFKALTTSENFLREPEPSLYLYRLTMDGRMQTGICGCFSVDEYDAGLIKVHEKTRRDKEDDRTRHLLTLESHAEPVFLAYKEDPEITARWDAEIDQYPALYRFTAPDGIEHAVWKLHEPQWYTERFSRVPATYIADGHHRAKSASRARAELRAAAQSFSGNEEFNFFMAVLFPHTQLKILPYNRLLRQLPLPATDLVKRIAQQFEVSPGSPSPDAKGLFSMYLDGRWLKLEPKERLNEQASAIDRLDVSILQNRLLAPLFGIDDPRTSQNIEFVGGIRGTKALEDAVDNGRAACAFSLYPVSMDELFAVADQGLSLPPKSTWFEPKLRSGLLIHDFK